MTVACPNDECECRAAWSVFKKYGGCPECRKTKGELFSISMVDRR